MLVVALSVAFSGCGSYHSFTIAVVNSSSTEADFRVEFSTDTGEVLLNRSGHVLAQKIVNFTLQSIAYGDYQLFAESGNRSASKWFDLRGSTRSLVVTIENKTMRVGYGVTT